MSSIKESFGESKKFLLLSLGVLVMALIVLNTLNRGLLTFSNTNEGNIYDKPEYVLDEDIDYKIVVTTTYGEIHIDLYESIAPENVNSLLFLIGERYYEGLTFHQVIKDFKLQAGDSKGDGSGDPGYSVSRENLVDFKDYDIGMANASQFFIVLPNSNKEIFNGEYTVVGRVVEGYAVVNSIQKVEVDKDYRPVNDVVIKSILIQEN